MVVLARRRSPPFIASVTAHCAGLALLALITRPGAGPIRPSSTEDKPSGLVWLNAAGRGGGGGGGGNRMKDPSRKPELPGRDQHTVPAATPPKAEAATPDPIDRDRLQQLIIPVVPHALGDTTFPGSMNAPPAPPTASRGPGSGPGAGTGGGSGDGPDRGRGYGRGLDEGMDGGFFQPGGEVTMPIEIRKGSPQYTTEAMRARAQGAITVQCVVQPNGVCSNIRVLRSFNPTFGLDQEAIKAASQWRFRPGMRRGQPVPVVVTMEIEFAVR